MKRSIFLLIFVTLVTACNAPNVVATQTKSDIENASPSATFQPSATPTATLLPSITPEPTTPPEPFLVQDGTLMARDEETGGYESVPKTDTGLYLIDGQLVGFDAVNNLTVNAFEPSGGNLKMWDEAAGRYRQVTVEIQNQPVNVKADNLITTTLGIVAEYKGGAAALIDPQTGEVFSLLNQVYLKDQTTLTPEGKLVVWDGEQDAWVDTVQLHENQVVYWEGRSFIPLENTFGEKVMANMQLETPQGLVFAQDGVLTAVVDNNRPVAAYSGEAPIGLNVYRLENGALVDTGKTWFDWRLYEPSTGEPRADLTHVNFPDAARVALGGMFVDPSIGRFRATLNNPGAITSFWNEIIKRSSSNEEQPILTFKAINLQTGQLETFSNVPVSQIDFYATAQDIPDGMPFLPFTTPYASSPAESVCFGLAFDTVTGKLIGTFDLMDKGIREWNRGVLASSLISSTGRVVLWGAGSPEFPTSISPVTGRMVLDQSSGQIDERLRQAGFSSGVNEQTIISWRLIK